MLHVRIETHNNRALGAAPPQGAGCHKEPDHPLDGEARNRRRSALQSASAAEQSIPDRETRGHSPVHRARRIVKRLVERSKERA